MQKDVFMEQLIKKRTLPFDMLVNVLIVVAAIVAVIFLLGPLQSMIAGFGSISMLVAVAVILGAIYLIYNKNAEFEYIFTNGELDVDTIVAKRRRTRLVSITCKNVTDVGLYQPGNSQEDSCAKVVNATSGGGQTCWYMVFGHATFGKTMLLFEPNEELVAVIKDAVPRELAQYAFNRG